MTLVLISVEAARWGKSGGGGGEDGGGLRRCRRFATDGVSGHASSLPLRRKSQIKSIFNEMSAPWCGPVKTTGGIKPERSETQNRRSEIKVARNDGVGGTPRPNIS